MSEEILSLSPLFTWRSAVASVAGPESPTTRHVLLTLSLHMNERGGSCFPSTRTLESETGLSRRAVEAHLQAAEESGWLVRERLGLSGQGWKRFGYAAVIPPAALRQLEALQAGERRAPRSEQVESKGNGKGGEPRAPRSKARSKGGERGAKRGERGAEGGERRSPEVVSEDVKEGVNGKNPAPVGAAQLTLVEQADPWNGGVLFDAWIKRKPGLVLSPSQRGKHGAAAKRLTESYTREQVRTAIVGMALIAPYVMGQPWDLLDLERRWANAYEAGLAQQTKPQSDEEEIERMARAIDERRRGR